MWAKVKYFVLDLCLSLITIMPLTLLLAVITLEQEIYVCGSAYAAAFTLRI
jgi:hypothetical protein